MFKAIQHPEQIEELLEGAPISDYFKKQLSFESKLSNSTLFFRYFNSGKKKACLTPYLGKNGEGI